MFIKNEKSDYTRQVFEFGIFLHAYDTQQFSHSVMSESLRPHELQPARLPCPSPSPGVAQTHVHWVGDAIQPSHALFSPSPPAFNLSQHQGLFQWVSSSHQVAKVLECQLQHQAFQWIFRTYLKWEYDIIFIVMQFGLSSSTMLSVFLSLFTYLWIKRNMIAKIILFVLVVIILYYSWY